MSMTPAPTTPARTMSDSAFRAAADAFLSWLSGTFINELNAVMGLAQLKGGWVSGTTYAKYDLVISPANFQPYLRTVAGAGTTDPSADTTNWTVFNQNIDPMVNDFRLTLGTGFPVTTSDVTGATTIYASSYTGNRIGLYVNGAWVVRQSPTPEFSKALGTLTSGLPYDVFCYDNAGVPTLEFLAWTNSTTRATALTRFNGILVKTGDATRRYLGTFFTTSTTTTEDSAANRYLWNYYNRVERPMKRTETTASWTYTTATFRQANASASNQLNFVIGVAEEPVFAKLSARCANSSAGTVTQTALGIDSTTTATAGALTTISNAANYYSYHSPSLCEAIAEGRHYIAWLEYSQAVGTTTWEGSSTFGLAGSLRG